MAGIDADGSGAEQLGCQNVCLGPGPTSYKDTHGTMKHIVNRLGEKLRRDGVDPSQTLDGGIVLATDYGGMGTAELSTGILTDLKVIGLDLMSL